jgi:hypothetical protein
MSVPGSVSVTAFASCPDEPVGDEGNAGQDRWAGRPAGVRDRAARQNDPSLQELLARVDDQTIATAIRGVCDLEQRWLAMPSGGTLRLNWPLARDFFPGAG